MYNRKSSNPDFPKIFPNFTHQEIFLWCDEKSKKFKSEFWTIFENFDYSSDNFASDEEFKNLMRNSLMRAMIDEDYPPDE